MDVSIIIVNYNTKRMTGECIDSVYAQTKGVEFEVIVVDNASRDGSVEALKGDKRVKLIASPENLGFGRANNKGLEAAQGKYIFFLNSDTLLANNAVKLFYDKMEACPERVACLGTLLRNGAGKRARSYGEFPTVRSSLFLSTAIYWLGKHFGHRWRLYDDPRRQKGHFFRVPYVTGADLFVRRSVIERFGAFDKRFFMYYEETDMQRRYYMHGYYSYIYDAPLIYHLEGGSTKKRSRVLRSRVLDLRSCYQYHRLHSSRGAYVVLRVLYPLLSLQNLFRFSSPWADRLHYVRSAFCVRVSGD